MTTSRKTTPEQVERMCELREAGYKLSAIAAEVGVPINTASWWLIREGIAPIRPKNVRGPMVDYIRKGRIVRIFTPEEDALIQKLSAQGMSNSAIAKQVNRRHNSVTNRLSSLGLRDAIIEAGKL